VNNSNGTGSAHQSGMQQPGKTTYRKGAGIAQNSGPDSAQ
jgi:hypothetical protein